MKRGDGREEPWLYLVAEEGRFFWGGFFLTDHGGALRRLKARGEGNIGKALLRGGEVLCGRMGLGVRGEGEVGAVGWL